MKIEYLTVPAQLLFNCLQNNSPVVFHYIGLNRTAVLRSLLYC